MHKILPPSDHAPSPAGVVDARRASAADEMSLVDVLRIFLAHARLLVVVPLIAGVLAFGAASMLRPTFTATTRITLPANPMSAGAMLAQQFGALGGLAGAAAGLKNPADQYIALLKSRTVADRLVQRFGLQQLYEQSYRQKAIDRLRGATDIATTKEGLISISVDDHDPKRAADIANAYVDELSTMMRTLAVGEASQRRQFFERQLAAARENLSRAELELANVGVGQGLLNVEPRIAAERVATLRAAITAAEVRLQTMRYGLAETHPDLRAAQQELAALRSQMTRLERRDAATEGDAARQGEYVARLRDFKYHGTLFELMSRQYEIARVDEAREGAAIQVVDPAVPPELKSGPKRALIAIVAAIATGLLLMVGVFVANAWRSAPLRPEGART